MYGENTANNPMHWAKGISQTHSLTATGYLDKEWNVVKRFPRLVLDESSFLVPFLISKRDDQMLG
jgi:hypothetical protein